jgi:predicted RNA-binding Zn-ribbon protein involved in translation (DUF1610 family)
MDKNGFSRFTIYDSRFTLHDLMEPEIARRCSGCGAAVRGGAQFCPECGKAVKSRAADADNTGNMSETPASKKADDGRETPSITTSQSSSVAETAASVAAVQEIPAAPVAGEERPHVVAATTPLTQEAEERSRRQRMATTSRASVEGKVAPRVERLRQASNVMLEEASSDPGLRFVLITIVIFILSLLLLLFNHLLR